MKWYPKKERKVKDSFSLIKKNGKYISSDDGKFIGEVLIDQDLALNLHNQITTDELLIELKLDPIEHYIEITEVISYHLSRYEYTAKVYQRLNINEMGYGVFELKYSPSFGNYFKDYKTTDEISTIVPRFHLKEQVLTFLKTPANSSRKNKKGVLLYGPPGNGKTTEIMSLFATAAEEKIRVFIVDRRVDFSDLASFKEMLGTEPTIFIFEELTQRTDREGTEELLTFLDGEYSWNNSVVIATTNYPKNLPENLVDRPGRFEQFLEYGLPTKEDILALAEKFGLENVSFLFNKDLSFDYVSFIMQQAKINNISVSTAFSEEAEKKRKISDTFKSKMGIGLADE